MTDSFPRQQARTRRFSLGAPRSFQISPDGGTVAFLRSRGGSDPVTCLWALDVASGQERLVADPTALGSFGAEDDEREKARRERVRELAAGIVGFATDRDCAQAVFAVAGHVYLAQLGTGTVRPLATRTPAADPRLDPAGRRVAYCCDGALRVVDLATGADGAVADPAVADPGRTDDVTADTDGTVSFGLAEFVAAEEMERTRGYWWAPDGSALLVARVDESPVQRWYIADPANPAVPAREVRYPAAGTANAEVTAFVASLAGQLTPVQWDHDALPYLVTACWSGSGPGADSGPGTDSRPGADGAGSGPGGPVEPRPLLLVVMSRDQREQRLLAVDPVTGATSTVRTDTDPHWVDIVPGVPAWTADDRIVWTACSEGTRRLLVATAAEHGRGTTAPVTPPGLQVREILSVDGEAVLFTASGDDPAQTGLWLAGPDGVAPVTEGDGVYSGQRSGGTTLISGRTLGHSGARVVVRRAAPDGEAAPDGAPEVRIESLAEQPAVPDPRPVLSYGGPRRLRTAVLLPSWHQPGSARLPVLCDPYGGPHFARVQAIRDAFTTSQWLAEQGFAVVIADGRGTPGRGPDWERAVAGDLADPVLEDQVAALQAAAAENGDLDLSRVGIRGWSFGGYLAALAVLRRPDVFHAAVAGAPVTDQRLYDTCYTERYLGDPNQHPDRYEHNSLIADAGKLSRPLMLIHGLADDNVVVAHSLRLSSALLAAGRPHTVLPLTGVTHMASQEDVAENLLLLQVDFLHSALSPASQAGALSR